MPPPSTTTTNEAARVDDSASEVGAARAEPIRATRYMAMSGEECLAELSARGVEHVPVERASVTTPVRGIGVLSGVRFRTLMTKPERERSPYEIFDCRLVLALDDFAKILRRHDI